MKVSVALLAGGQSSRMGRSKASLEVEGEPLLYRNIRLLQTRFDEILVSVPRQGLPIPLPEEIRLIPDPVDFQGPLIGIEATLSASLNPKCLIIAADIPMQDLGLIDSLLAVAGRAEITVVSFGGQRDEPLFGVYDRLVLLSLQSLRESGERRVLQLLALCRAERIVLNKPWWFMNLNTSEDYRQFIERLEQWREKQPSQTT